MSKVNEFFDLNDERKDDGIHIQDGYIEDGSLLLILNDGEEVDFKDVIFEINDKYKLLDICEEYLYENEEVTDNYKNTLMLRLKQLDQV